MRFNLAVLRLHGRGLFCSGLCGALALGIAIVSDARHVTLTNIDPVTLSIYSHARVEPESRTARPATAKLDESAAASGSGTGFTDLLGSKSVLVANTLVQSRWDAALSEAANRTLLSACAEDAGICSTPKLAAMRAEIRRLRVLPLGEQIAGVNRFVNTAFRYATDLQTYGKSDHWALLREFLAREQGDCEDFAIAKFWMLVALDVPVEAIRLVVLRDVQSRADHAVLAVEHGGEALILDNRSNAVRANNELGHYRPIFSMSGNGGIWVHLLASMSVARAD